MIAYNYGHLLTTLRPAGFCSVPLLLVWILQAHTDPEEPKNRPTYRAAPQVLKGDVETLIITWLPSC